MSPEVPKKRTGNLGTFFRMVLDPESNPFNDIPFLGIGPRLFGGISQDWPRRIAMMLEAVQAPPGESMIFMFSTSAGQFEIEKRVEVAGFTIHYVSFTMAFQ